MPNTAKFLEKTKSPIFYLILLPMFFTIVWTTFGQEVITINNWRLLLMLIVVTGITYSAGMFWLMAKYIKAIKDRSKNTFKKVVMEILGVAAFFLFFLFLNPIGAWKDLQGGMKEYTGNCSVKRSYNATEAPRVRFYIEFMDGGKAQSIRAGLFKNISCEGRIKIQYLPSSKMALHTENIK